MAFVSGGSSDTSGEFMRRLGSNELFCHFCHNVGNLNVMTGLTLLTRHAIDEGKQNSLIFNDFFIFRFSTLNNYEIWETISPRN